jgi:glutamate synthase (NADPH/NADH) small chain
MDRAPEQKRVAKRVWAEVDRADPPKRPAECRVADFHEIYSLHDEKTVREQASRCVQCHKPNCVEGCPLHNRIPEWLALAAEGDFLGAAEISRSTSNMPEICSRVCPQERLCEGSCILSSRSEPICIGAIEKFINEYALARGAAEVTVAPANGFSVAVVGSGPGGMACADELAKLGYEVTVFESQLLPGGLLVNGIPAFKLEKSIVERRINLLRRKGVIFKLGVTVGKEISLEKLQKDFDAIFMGIGAQKAKTLDIPGAELKGVHQALPFLIQKNSALPLEIPDIDVKGKRVVVLGGGDTAMDCLRTAIRCGALEATCAYRRDLANMPGSRKEYANALEEGAKFVFLTNPTALYAKSVTTTQVPLTPALSPLDGEREKAESSVSGVRCVKMELGEADSSGRRKPRAVPGSEFCIEAEIVLVAYGFDPVPFPERSDLRRIKVNSWGGLEIDENQMTSVPGVFAGGDSTRGPSLVVHAVRDGRNAAQGIHRYLSAPRGAEI